MAVTTTDLAERLGEAHGLSKTQAKSIVEEVLKGIEEAAVKGEEISLNGFGKIQGSEQAGTRGPPSGDRRNDPDRGVEEADLPAGEGAQGCDER